jgi:DNA polymerase-3 subunit delta'
LSPSRSEASAAVPLPRETSVFFGHAEAERALLEAYRSGRLPHAFLLGGPPGIGKATLAYRLARFVLAHSDPAAPAVARAQSLALDPQHPVARRVAGLAHGNLLVLERTENESGSLRTTIAVDDVRRSVPFFGATAGEGGWRVAIVDAVDDLNAAGANALLKVLEEPPERALFLLVSHAPGRVPATIRSRTRALALRPLAAPEVAAAAAAALGRPADDPEIAAAAAGADGSVARALMLLEGSGLALRQRVNELLERLPQIDARALHGLADALGGSDPEPLMAFMDTVNAWLAASLARAVGQAKETARLDRIARSWQEVNRAANDTEEFNLERRPLVFAVFGALAEAARAERS